MNLKSSQYPFFTINLSYVIILYTIYQFKQRKASTLYSIALGALVIVVTVAQAPKIFGHLTQEACLQPSPMGAVCAFLM